MALQDMALPSVRMSLLHPSPPLSPFHTYHPAYLGGCRRLLGSMAVEWVRLTMWRGWSWSPPVPPGIYMSWLSTSLLCPVLLQECEGSRLWVQINDVSYIFPQDRRFFCKDCQLLCTVRAGWRASSFPRAAFPRWLNSLSYGLLLHTAGTTSPAPVPGNRMKESTPGAGCWGSAVWTCRSALSGQPTQRLVDLQCCESIAWVTATKGGCSSLPPL